MTSPPSAIEDLDILPDGRVRPSLRMSEDEFVAWCDEDVKAEWVDGEVIIMSPTSLRHVELTAWIQVVLTLFVKRKALGRVLGTEFMIRLGAQRRRRVPDVLFIAKDREHLLRPNHFEGSPDAVFEVISPESQSRDRRDKFAEYQDAGVREYWLIDPLSRTVEAYALDAGGRYQRIDPAAEDGRLVSLALPGFYLQPAWLWQPSLPDELGILRELGVAF